MRKLLIILTLLLLCSCKSVSNELIKDNKELIQNTKEQIQTTKDKVEKTKIIVNKVKETCEDNNIFSIEIELNNINNDLILIDNNMNMLISNNENIKLALKNDLKELKKKLSLYRSLIMLLIIFFGYRFIKNKK